VCGWRPRTSSWPSLECEASVSGSSLTLPAKKLYEIVKALPETDVRIEEDKNGVKVAADRFAAHTTMAREDFPTLPEAKGDGIDRVHSGR
jgi:DNA polymerase III sliding clamp (beta) subunit (PCNA family)